MIRMTKDLTSVYKKYKGSWVAFDKDYSRVIASGKNASTVFNKAKKKTNKTPKLFKVPSNLTAYIGYVLHG